MTTLVLAIVAVGYYYIGAGGECGLVGSRCPLSKGSKVPFRDQINREEGANSLGFSENLKASTFLSKLGRKAAAPGELVYSAIQVAGLCGTAGKYQKRPKQVEQFCDVHPSELGDLTAQIRELPPSDPIAEAYEYSALALSAVSDPDRRATGGEIAYLSDKLDGLLRSKSAGAGALIASETLEQIGYVSKDFDKIPEEIGIRMSKQDLLSAQTLGAQMSYCDTRGGCAAGEITTLQNCLIAGNCNSFSGATYYWEQRYSKNQLDVARKIAQKMTTGIEE